LMAGDEAGEGESPRVHGGVVLRERPDDRGSRAGEAEYPKTLDEYIWLDGRAVAMMRSRVEEVGGEPRRAVDFEGVCPKGGEESNCGTYFVVTDHLPKGCVSGFE